MATITRTITTTPEQDATLATGVPIELDKAYQHSPGGDLFEYDVDYERMVLRILEPGGVYREEWAQIPWGWNDTPADEDEEDDR